MISDLRLFHQLLLLVQRLPPQFLRHDNTSCYLTFPSAISPWPGGCHFIHHYTSYLLKDSTTWEANEIQHQRIARARECAEPVTGVD